MVFTGVLAALAAVAFAFCLWQKIWPKFQCWMLVVVGAGAAGLIGTTIHTGLDKASSATNQATQLVFGVVTPSLLMVWVLLGFTIEMLPDKVVGSRPVTWHTRACALLLPSAIVLVPTLANTIMSSAGV